MPKEAVAVATTGKLRIAAVVRGAVKVKQTIVLK